MERAFSLLCVLVSLACSGLDVHAHWRCHECIESVTVHVQLARDRYSGSDNEGPAHFLNFTYLCTPRPNAGVPANKSLTQVGAQVPSIEAASSSGMLRNVTRQDGVVLVAYKAANHKVLMNGWMERGTTSTYTKAIPEEALAMCGKCVTPSELGTAFVVAGNRDGIQIKTMTVVANLQKEESSVLLMIDRKFENGWIDTNDYPRKANRKIKLTKAGC